MPDQLTMEYFAELDTSVLEDLSFSSSTCLSDSPHRRSLREVFLGAGGSALVHGLVGIIILISASSPPPKLVPPYLTVNLVAMEGARGGGCDTGFASKEEGYSRNEEHSSPANALQEQALPPITPEAVSPFGPMPKPEKKRVKTKRAPAAIRTTPAQATPADTGEDPKSAFSGHESCPEVAGTGSGEEYGVKGSAHPLGGSLEGAGGRGGEYHADAVDQVPQVLHRVEPTYPPRARKQGVCGKVVLRFLVETSGKVSRPSIVEASPEGYFEQSALEAIRHWRFKPGIYRGEAVATWVVLPVAFKLTG